MRTYTGKWGKFQCQCVTDRKLTGFVEEGDALPGYEVFKHIDEDGEIKDVKSRDLNAYVKVVVGAEFTAKDFRTCAGTLLAAMKLAELGAEEDLKKAEQNVVAAVDAVAQRLVNTRAIARSSYVRPHAIDHYWSGR